MSAASSTLSTPIAFTRQPPAAVRELVVSCTGPSPPIPPAGHSGQWPPTAGTLPRRASAASFASCASVSARSARCRSAWFWTCSLGMEGDPLAQMWLDDGAEKVRGIHQCPACACRC